MPHATSSQRVSTPRILFIDAHDSFTNNVVSLLETELGVEVTVIHIDDEIVDLPTFLKPFAAVVAGPGPGDPRNPKDVGLIREVWKLNESSTLLPVLGICLGFQSLVLHFGGSVDRLPQPRHGIVRRVRSQCQSIFGNHGFIETIVYHSLHASLHHSNPLTADDELWKSSSECPDLRPLAYDFEIDQQPRSASTGGETCCLGAEGEGCEADGCVVCDAGKPLEESTSALLANSGAKCSSPPILMAVEHITKPFVGLQFHPESICSSANARGIISSWWDDARHWNTRHRYRVKDPEPSYLHKLLSKLPNASNRSGDFPHIPPVHNETPSFGHGRPKLQVHTRVIDIGSLSIPSICETLDLTKGNAIVLDSEMHQMHEVGQYSIIGVTTPDTIRIEYKAGLPTVYLTRSGKDLNLEDFGFGGSIFSYLTSFMRVRQAETDHVKVPFSGGLMGYISYEACLETVGIRKASTSLITSSSLEQPDLSFAFVERSIVIDHFQQTLHVQSITADDIEWVNDTAARLQHSASIPQGSNQTTLPRFEAHITLPDEEIYKSQVRTCQSSIRAGDSYELCLTTQATIKTSTRISSWPLYQRLRKLNPSPFSAYMRLGKLTLLCSSPERFLRWSRPTIHGKDGGSNDDSVSGPKISTCQFRPIKGTVKRQPNHNLPPLNLAEATALLSTPKERAENLMIVDLIRHDLHGVVGSGRVSVPKLMVVEEYATLFQLVSVIEGNLLIEESEPEFDAAPATHFGRDRALVTIHNGPYKGLMGTPQDFTDTEARVDLTNSGKTITMSKDSLTFPSQNLIKSHFPAQKDATKTGIDVLAASLPPGSMTGAPKLRSCQILGEIEKRERGVYSGVVGYMDVGGGGDFNVVIRSAFRWDDDSPLAEEGGEKGEEKDDNACGEGDTWTIGAGGAVTILSTADGEWEEMVAKLRSTLRLFEHGDGEQIAMHASS